jgi:hypothetical protein
MSAARRANDVRKICASAVFVYIENLRFPYYLHASSSLSPVSMELSRKRFFAKLLGLAALGGIASRRLVAIATDRVTRPAGRPGRSWALRPEPRAVARRADSL